MVLNILANAGVLIVAIYFYFKINNSTTYYFKPSNTQHLFYIASVSTVGLILLNFSIVVADLRYDFRGLLFALAMRYIGWKTTLPSIFILLVARFFWGAADIAFANVFLSLYMILTLPLLMGYIKSRFSDFMQLTILLSNNILGTAFATFFLIENTVASGQIIVLFFGVNLFLLFLCQLIIDDFRSMVSKINQDCLTSLNNHRRFHEDLQILNEMRSSVTIALLDIDYFKKYNDNFGHDVGDLILKKVSETMQKHTSPNVNFYRVGGEEFAMIIVDHSTAVAESMVKTVHQAVSGADIDDIAEYVLSPTVSIGVAHVSQGESLEMAYKRADKALYLSKNNGRNQVQVSSYVTPAI